MKILAFRVQSEGLRCQGCGRVKWIDRKSLLCLLCLSIELDRRDPLLAQMRRKFAKHGAEIKTRLAEFNSIRPA